METLEKMNGFGIDALGRVLEGLGAEEGKADFVFRTRTRWVGAGHSRTSVTGFFGAFQEQNGRSFLLEADEPTLMLGGDTAPNPVEHLLHALAACMTATLAYNAAAHGIELRACECTLRGEIDLRGVFDIAPVRPGFSRIEVSFVVESDAPAERLEELARRSPVLDVVERGTKVDIRVEAVPIPEQTVPLVEPETV